MNSAELFVKCLEAEGVKHIFSLPGEETIDLLKALTSSTIEVVTTHDERWAAFMANAYGRLTGKPGVCLSTLGPGATNLMTGVADALLDFSPMVAITGQTSIAKTHKESHQYIDILSAFRTVTKWNARIESPNVIPEIVRKAFKTASAEKPGPSHIEFPENVALNDAVGNPVPHETEHYPEPSEDAIDHAVTLIRDANFPLVLAGNGIIRGKASHALREFISRTHIGVAATFMGMGALPSDDDRFISTVGLQSRDYISCGFEKADLIIAVGYDPVEFSPRYWNPDTNKRIIHIHFVPSETDSHYPAIEIIGDIARALSLLSERLDGREISPYYLKLKGLADHGVHFSHKGFPLRPLRILKEIRHVLGRTDILISDVGAHKIWIARFFPAYAENTVLISNGFASMGFGIPAAISAKLLFPERKVIAAVGDGGFLMSMCEINTAVRLGISFVCLIFNDGGYGLIEWKEKLRYKESFHVKFNTPDFVRIAESFGARGYRISSEDELLPVLNDALSQAVPSIIDCPVDYSDNLTMTEKLGRLICPM